MQRKINLHIKIELMPEIRAVNFVCHSAGAYGCLAAAGFLEPTETLVQRIVLAGPTPSPTAYEGRFEQRGHPIQNFLEQVRLVDPTFDNETLQRIARHFELSSGKIEWVISTGDTAVIPRDYFSAMQRMKEAGISQRIWLVGDTASISANRNFGNLISWAEQRNVSVLRLSPSLVTGSGFSFPDTGHHSMFPLAGRILTDLISFGSAEAIPYIGGN